MYKLNLIDKVLLVSGITISVIYFILSMVYSGYLPEPIFYVKSDTFMDFHHIQYWTYDVGRYTEWKSIYTPFSFFLVGIFTSSLPGDAFELRNDSAISLSTFLLIAVFFTAYFQSKLISIQNKHVWIFSLLFSVPFLFTIERGNLLIYALLFLLIGVINYRKSFIFSFFLAMAISLKIYLIALLFIPFLNFHFSKIVLTLSLVLVINVVSANILGDVNWLLFLDNIFEFSSDTKHYEWSYFTYSYQNILLAFTHLIPDYKDIGILLNVLALVTVLTLFLFVSIKYFLSSTCFRARERNTLFLLLLMLIMIVVKNSGGYVFILLFPFLSAIIFNRFSFYMFLLLILPIEITLIELDTIPIDSFISGDQVDIERNVTLGMITRPLLFLALYFSISINFLRKKRVYV